MRVLRFAAIVVGLALASTAVAAGLVTSSLMVPFTGLFSPNGFESVALVGNVHIVTQLYPGDPCHPTDPCRVFVNLADMKGIGLNSGRPYVAIGADVLYPTDPCMPTDPCRAPFVIMSVATPSDPTFPSDPVLPITFEVVLALDPASHLLQDGTVVSLPECVHDVGC